MYRVTFSSFGYTVNAEDKIKRCCMKGMETMSAVELDVFQMYLVFKELLEQSTLEEQLKIKIYENLELTDNLIDILKE